MFRLVITIILMAIVGALASGLAAFKIYEQEESLGRIALARAVDSHAALVQERLSERELLTRVTVGLFRSPASDKANALVPLRSSIYAFKTDFVVAGWIPRVPLSELAQVQSDLKTAGFPNPILRNADDSPLDQSKLKPPAIVLMDVEPQNDQTRAFVGRVFNNSATLAPLFERVISEGKPVSSDPLHLLKPDGPMGVVLAAPVRQGNDIVGFMTISYKLLPLMLTSDEAAPFAVALRDPRDASNNLKADESNEVVDTPLQLSSENPPLLRIVNFGEREWNLIYYPKTSSIARAQEIATIVLAIGMAITAVLCGLFGYVSYNNIRLSREIQTRIGFERRLTAVIDELNHRVKNILAVIQSIVTRTMRHGSDIDTARELLIGRIHAMSHVVSLLSESQWQGVKLKGLFESRAIPHGERIALNGPDIVVSARAAQSLSLLFFELASHADEGHSLVGKPPQIVAQWSISGKEPDTTFDFRWEEFNTSAATRRADSEFGQVLLDRVVPEALGGTSKRYFTDVSYVYELNAPMVTVVDEKEMSRTGKLGAPVRRK
ncbi:MAG: CHASE domain-containing protein [Rhizobiales bacterium]|nr:CHASE domain-containing protein [Hyphomicrobiales bacterium]